MEDAPFRLSRPLLAAGAGGILLLGGAIWLWTERAPIATSYIDDALTARGVPARYRLTQIGFRTQRIEGISIGDPRNPDLTADWAEIELAVGLSGVRVVAIDAGGAHLRARVVDGKLSLGAIDRLVPTGQSKEPFELPDIALTARNMRFDLETNQGFVRASLNGKGNLRDGFRGTASLGSERLASGGCAVAGLASRLAVAIDGGRPAVRGPVEARTIACAQGRVTAPRIDVDARGDRDLARWRGSLAVRRGQIDAGTLRVAALGGRLGFDASAQQILGKGDLFATGLRQGGNRIGRASILTDVRFEPSKRKATAKGEIKLAGAKVDPILIGQVKTQLEAAANTPIGPIAAAWGVAVERAARNVDAALSFAIDQGPENGAVRIERLDVMGQGGGRLLIRSEQAEGLGWRWPQGGAVVNASASMTGGGLPDLLLSVRQTVPGAPLTGSATIAPYSAGDARLRLTPIRFGTGPRGGTEIATEVTLNGPLADGRVEGLGLPIRLALGRGGRFTLNPDCAALRFDRIAIAGTVIARGKLPLCPVGGALVGRDGAGRLFGGARIASPRLRGQVGDQPLTMESRTLAVTVGKPGFALDDLAIRLGDPANPTRLDIARLHGVVGAKGLGGRFEGTAGKIAAVPLLLSEGAGGWTLASSRLLLDGAVRVADAETASPRFHPLTANDVRLSLEGGMIAGTATLREPRSNAAISRVALRHDLARGEGGARLDVDGLRFGQGLQPEAVTPLTLGMIANVYGVVSGEGRIRWADGNVRSDGSFRTEGINLAAAFGPVTGLKGVIRFTDLLGLVTAPDQEVTIQEINPGIAVNDGVIHYRLLPDHKLSIADGRWPFAGGTLALEPSVLDMAQPVARRLTFRIDGLDAATFIQQLEFKNLAVTGKFDGVLPIVFDARGGRIENGELKVRPGGGTLSYVGDVTNADLGRMARIAFDALKSMRYDKLTIDLNGDLDGEIVSKVRFDGTNDKPQETARAGGIIGRILAPITRLPFRFNITITAPFRGLVNSAQTFVDPSIVLRNTAAGVIQTTPAPGQAPVRSSNQPAIQPPIQPR